MAQFLALSGPDLGPKARLYFPSKNADEIILTRILFSTSGYKDLQPLVVLFSILATTSGVYRDYNFIYFNDLIIIFIKFSIIVLNQMPYLPTLDE